MCTADLIAIDGREHLVELDYRWMMNHQSLKIDGEKVNLERPVRNELAKGFEYSVVVGSKECRLLLARSYTDFIVEDQSLEHKKEYQDPVKISWWGYLLLLPYVLILLGFRGIIPIFFAFLGIVQCIPVLKSPYRCAENKAVYCLGMAIVTSIIIYIIAFFLG